MRKLVALAVLPLLFQPLLAEAGQAAPRRHAAVKLINPLSIDRHETRIFLPLHNVHITKERRTVASFQLELTSTSPGIYAVERPVNRGVLHHLRIESFERKTYLEAAWRYASPVQVNVGAHGVEIVFNHEVAHATFKTVAAGVRYWEGQRWTNAGPQRLRVLKLDPKQIMLRPVVAGQSARHMGLETVSTMARRAHAIAAVNGGYFSPRTGAPQGTVVLNRTLVSRTMLDRPSLWLKQDGSAYIKVEKPTARICLDDGGAIACQAINEKRPKHDRVTLFTAQFGTRTRTIKDPSRWEVAIAKSGVVVNESHGDLPIPAGGYVASGQGTGAAALREAIGHGQALRVSFSLAEGVVQALGGGPTLLKDGRIDVLAHQERFHADVARGRSPRTAIGLLANGGYVLICIDGRRPGYSVGATLGELAQALRDFGAVDAMNLDGGGSSSMWLRGRLINHPSDGRARPVSTALLVLPRNHQVASVLQGMLAANPH